MLPRPSLQGNRASSVGFPVVYLHRSLCKVCLTGPHPGYPCGSPSQLVLTLYSARASLTFPVDFPTRSVPPLRPVLHSPYYLLLCILFISAAPWGSVCCAYCHILRPKNHAQHVGSSQRPRRTGYGMVRTGRSCPDPKGSLVHALFSASFLRTYFSSNSLSLLEDRTVPLRLASAKDPA